MAPRMTNDEYLASLEAKLAEDKAKAEEKIAASIAATEAKIAAAKAKAEERQASLATKLDEQIAAAKTSVEKAQARLAALEEKRAELSPATEQPELPAEDEQPADDQVSTRRGRKSDAA